MVKEICVNYLLNFIFQPPKQQQKGKNDKAQTQKKTKPTGSGGKAKKKVRLTILNNKKCFLVWALGDVMEHQPTRIE